VALAEVVICSGYPTQIAIIALLALAGWVPVGESGRLSTYYVLTLSTLDAVLLIGLVVFFLRAHGERPARVMFGRGVLTREIVLGVLLTPFVLLLAIGILAAVQHWAPWLHNVPRNPLEDLIGTRFDAVLFGVVSVFAGGVREEVQRAFVLTRFERYLGGAVPGLIFFSFAFGAGHMIQGYDAAVATGVLGLFWGIVYLARRNIAAPVISHSLFNITEIVFHITHA
jgi:membrane protease YdiL (CAAX protease family)